MTTSAARSPSRTGDTLAVALLALSSLIISVDFNIVYVALPDIGRELGFSAQSLQWVVSAYAVGFGGFLLLGGRAADRLGARRVFVLGLALFGVASLAAGLAADPAVLVAARVAQGLGGALLFPSTLALINTRFEEGPTRTRALSLWGVAGSSGALVGPMAGGVLTNAWGWELVFFVNIPLTLAAGIAAFRTLPADAPRGSGRGGFDLPGAMIATAGSSLVVFGLVSGPEAGWTSLRGAGAITAGLLALVAFLLVQARTADPLVPPRLLTNRTLVTATALIFVLMSTVGPLHYVFTIYLQDVLGYSALATGLGFLPLSLLAIVGAGKLLPGLLNRFGPRTTLLVGMVGIAAGMALITAALAADGSYWTLVPGVILFGLFAGMAYPAIFAVVGSDVAPGEQGVASALASTSQQIGGAVGLAVLVAVANAGVDLDAPATGDVVAGLRMAGWVGALMTLAGAGIVLRLRRRAPAQPELEVASSSA